MLWVLELDCSRYAPSLEEATGGLLKTSYTSRRQAKTSYTSRRQAACYHTTSYLHMCRTIMSYTYTSLRHIYTGYGA
jgi:hypothetical protein